MCDYMYVQFIPTTQYAIPAYNHISPKYTPGFMQFFKCININANYKNFSFVSEHSYYLRIPKRSLLTSNNKTIMYKVRLHKRNYSDKYNLIGSFLYYVM